MKHFTIARDNGEHLDFDGEVIGFAEASANGMDFAAAIYETAGLNLVGQVTRTWHDSGRQIIAAEVWHKPAELYRWLSRQKGTPDGHLSGATLDAWRAACEARPARFTTTIE